MIDQETPITPDARTAIEQDEPIEAHVSSDRQERTLAALATIDDARSLDELAADVADSDGDADGKRASTGGGPADSSSAERIEIELYHHHLPKLVAQGLVERESSRGPFRLTPAGAECLTLLDERN